MRRGALDRPARAKATHHREVEPIAALVRFATDRHRDIEVFADRETEELWWRDSDDLHAVAVDTNPRKTGYVAATKLAQPVGVAENDMGGRTRSRIRCLEQSSAPRFDAEYREDVRARDDAGDASEIRALPDAHVPRRPGEHVGERLLVPAQLAPDGSRQLAVAAGIQPE